jgi:hypothetical protein
MHETGRREFQLAAAGVLLLTLPAWAWAAEASADGTGIFGAYARAFKLR